MENRDAGALYIHNLCFSFWVNSKLDGRFYLVIFSIIWSVSKTSFYIPI
jgi:hypothetical protein